MNGEMGGEYLFLLFDQVDFFGDVGCSFVHSGKRGYSHDWQMKSIEFLLRINDIDGKNSYQYLRFNLRKIKSTKMEKN